MLLDVVVPDPSLQPPYLWIAAGAAGLLVLWLLWRSRRRAGAPK